MSVINKYIWRIVNTDFAFVCVDVLRLRSWAHSPCPKAVIWMLCTGGLTVVKMTARLNENLTLFIMCERHRRSLLATGNFFTPLQHYPRAVREWN